MLLARAWRGVLLATMLVLGPAAAGRAESPYVAELATFFYRYDQDPPRLDAIRAGLEQAVASDPDLPNLVALAQVSFLWGDIRATSPEEKLAAYDRGRQAGQRAVVLAPQDALAHLWFAINTARWGQTKGVLRSLFLLPTVKREIETILRLDPTLAPAYALAGNVYYEVPGVLGGDVKRAERMFRRGLSLQPNFTAMRVGLAKTLIKQGRPVEAAQELRRVLREREPENPADWAMQDRPQASRLLDSIAG